MQTARSKTYLDTLAALSESRVEGISYAQFTKGELTHVKSLVAEGHVAWFTEEEQTYGGAGALAFLTVQGADYVSALTDAGILSAPVATPTKPKAKRTKKPTASKPVEEILDGVSIPKGSVKRKKVTSRTTKPKASINSKVSLELSSVEADALRRLLSMAETQTLLAGPVASL